MNENESLFLSSNAPIVYSVDVKTNTVLLKINNEDNPPLRINEAAAFQLKWNLLAWLEKGSGYRLVFGDSSATAPGYDLAFFKDSVRNLPFPLNYSTPEKNMFEKQEKVNSTMFENKIIMWTVIGVVLSVLVFFTIKLTKEISKKE
jgi:hypothetical protein